jgi:hypothetical protein
MTAPRPALNGLSKKNTKLLTLQAGDSISVSQGLTMMKEVWSSANRLAKLEQKYSGKAIPPDELFGAIVGIGGETNPLAEVEKQLSEISAKLDLVLAGIEQIRKDILGSEVLTIYLYMKDAVYIVDKYFRELSSFTSAGTSKTAQERAKFLDKLLGKRNERDAVAFNANQIANLDARQRPLFFDRLFPYILTGATVPETAERYMQGALMFRWVTDALVKALLLELFIETASGDSSTMSTRTQKVLTKYQQWMRSLIDNSFLLFAEQLATLRFREEFNGGNTISYDMHLPFANWTAAQPSILQSADELAARLLGYFKSVTLRVIPNVPPVAELVPTPPPEHSVSAGDYFWEILERPQTPLTKESLLNLLQTGKLITLCINRGKKVIAAQHVVRSDITFMEGAALPLGYDKKLKKLSFLRFEYDLTRHAHSTTHPEFAFFFMLPTMVQNTQFPVLVTKWRYVYIEEGRKFYHGFKDVVQAPITNSPGLFDLPAEGQLSLVLVTYAYNFFAHRKRS